MTTRIRSAFAASTGFVAAVTPPKPRANQGQAQPSRNASSRSMPQSAAPTLREAA